MSATQGVLVLLALTLAAGQALADSADENIEIAAAKADVAEVEGVDKGAEGAEEATGEEEAEVDTVISGGPNATKGLLHCTYERPVGSHIPKRVCRTMEQRENDRFVARRQVREAGIARDQMNQGRGR